MHPLPLIPLNDDGITGCIYLKLENLQPIGSYKLRGAGNVILSSDPHELKQGIVTLSAGNLGQGVAWYARRLGFTCTILVPEHAPTAKTNALKRMGADVRKLDYDTWWGIMRSGECHDYPGVFIHPVLNKNMMAGHGTIGLEIIEQMPDVDGIIVPFGGGAMISGIAVAAKQTNADISIYGCEVESGAPLAAALKHDGPVEIEYTPSFVDGIGSPSIFPEMWPILKEVVRSSIVVSLEQVTEAIRILARRHHVIAEGAGAAALAAGLTLKEDNKKVVCVISGGNINFDVLVDILRHSS